ncbi:MAG: flagellar assembly protein FliX [Amphiplicatus sp.]
MIRVSGVGTAAASTGPRKTSRAGAGFRVESGLAAGASVETSPAAPVETLGALIAIQSDAAGSGRARAKAVAAAALTLDLLDRLHLGFIDGTISPDDLEALARAASVRAEGVSSDARLADLHEEIALRARVELAKLGR